MLVFCGASWEAEPQGRSSLGPELRTHSDGEEVTLSVTHGDFTVDHVWLVGPLLGLGFGSCPDVLPSLT
jgi:hypothetical protein